MMLRYIPDTYWTTQEELTLFGGAILLGIPAGLFFDLFRLLRRLLPHRTAAVAAEDVLWLLGVGTLLLCYASGFAKGVFRGYFAVGCGLGFVLYECTLGRLLLPAAERTVRLLLRPLQRAAVGIALICKKGAGRFVKVSKKWGVAKKMRKTACKERRKRCIIKNIRTQKAKQTESRRNRHPGNRRKPEEGKQHGRKNSKKT